jgi:AcrR family transcriptional regulator
VPFSNYEYTGLAWEPPAGGMIETPWGDAQRLRKQRLRPGPGTPPEEVARNQRSRLFGAMVASVAERGYAATRLSDLTELSGVGRKSFYSHFVDKEECFVAAIEAMLETAIESTTAPVGSWEQQVRGSASAFAPWRDLMAIHYDAFRASIEIQAESAARLHRSGDRGIPGSSVQAMFELPKQGMHELPKP